MGRIDFTIVMLKHEAGSLERRNPCKRGTLPQDAYVFSRAKPEPDQTVRMTEWLRQAARLGDEKAAHNLLECGVNPNARDKHSETPLHLAAANGRTIVASMLIERHADVNALDDMGWTPLVMAASYGKLGVVRLLLENGANIGSVGDSGETPLGVAIMWNHRKTADFLRSHGASE